MTLRLVKNGKFWRFYIKKPALIAFASLLLIGCVEKPQASVLAKQGALPAAPGVRKRPDVQVRDASQKEEKLDCIGEVGISSPGGNFGRRKLLNGYEASVQASNSDNAYSDKRCSGAIYDSSGKIVYSTSGPDIYLDPSTGMDIDGDGAPDVVFANGANGNGGGGDWELEVVSLSPKPHRLPVSFGGQAPSFSKDSKGRVVLSTYGRWWGGEIQNTYELPNAVVGQQARDYRFVEGKLTEVTPEYCAEIEPKLFHPSKEQMADFRASKLTDLDSDDVAHMLNLLMQWIFCRQFDQTLELIHDAWPEEDQMNLIATLKKESKKWDCSECEKAIAVWP